MGAGALARPYHPQLVALMMPFHEVSILRRQHAIRGAEQQGQARVNEIDLRQRDCQIAGQHHALVQDIVDDVEERRLFGGEDALRVRHRTPLRRSGRRCAARRPRSRHG